MLDDFDALTLDASLIDAAIMVMACENHKTPDNGSSFVDAAVLRDKFLTNARPFLLTPPEVQWLHRAVRMMDTDEDGKWVDRGDAKTRVLRLLEECWAKQTGGSLT